MIIIARGFFDSASNDQGNEHRIGETTAEFSIRDFEPSMVLNADCLFQERKDFLTGFLRY
jgi:hypothetical protein